MASSAAGAGSVGNGVRRQRTFLGHPVGLYVLFFTEMWERFSYYGMRGLLMLYMVNYFLWAQTQASNIYKWYTSLVYLTPLIGGYLADRYLGNKRAVIIGAVLMGFGQFMLTIDLSGAFFSALALLIIGNGFFKPNMSTQVGRLYPKGDVRTDGAYTIFYMGVNLGAFLSPLVCGWLAENTIGGYHSGFTAAGIGMFLGLAIYLLGQPWVEEIQMIGTAATDRKDAAQGEEIQPGGAALSEAAAEHTPSTARFLNRLTPGFMLVAGCLLAVGAPFLAPKTHIHLGSMDIPITLGLIAWDTVVALEILAVISLISSWITSRVHQAERDRVLTIYILGVFVVCFWAGFEQAGNVLNLWADKSTDRVLFATAPHPSIYPKVVEKDISAGGSQAGFWQRWVNMFRPLPAEEPGTDKEGPADKGYTVPTPWFQSINALAIFVLAPVFAYMWTALNRRGLNPSTPTKMAIALVCMALSLAVMVGAARQEDRPSAKPLLGEKLPSAIVLNEANQLCHREDDGTLVPYHSGRLWWNPANHTLEARGVLPDIERDRIVRDTAPPDFVKKVKELAEKTQEASPPIEESVQLERVPPGFDWGYAGFSKKKVSYDEKTRTLTARIRLADKDVKAILVAGGEPELREALNALMKDSSEFRVSPWWLFWSYILATFGELCLSPVGLSMVSKLAPAKFATMLMGLWLLLTFFGNFGAGALGEYWERFTPTNFFLIIVCGLGAAAVVLFSLVRKVVTMMHGVN